MSIALARVVAIAGLASVLVSGSVAADEVAIDVDALVARMAQTYATETRGVLGVCSSSELRIEAPVFHKTIAEDTWFVFRDGALAESGKPQDPRRPPLHEPYRAEYLAEYRYTLVPCATCTRDTVAIAFASDARDTQHARGSLVVDRASARIIESDETPYKLPWPTSDGSLTASWGAVDGGWFPLAIAGAFVGRIGPFVGHARYRQRLTDYARYASLDDATRALKGQADGR